MIGRISIGRVVEKNGKRLPEKDDQFTITTQIQTKEGWLPHPLDEALRKETQGSKLRSIPITLPFNDPDLNLRAEYTFFERKSGRPLCAGDGRFPFFSTTRPILIRPITGGVIASPLIMRFS